MVNYQQAEEGPCGENLKILPSNGDLNSKNLPVGKKHIYLSTDGSFSIQGHYIAEISFVFEKLIKEENENAFEMRSVVLDSGFKKVSQCS